jgi:hypothetical protein
MHDSQTTIPSVSKDNTREQSSIGTDPPPINSSKSKLEVSEFLKSIQET